MKEQNERRQLIVLQLLSYVSPICRLLRFINDPHCLPKKAAALVGKPTPLPCNGQPLARRNLLRQTFYCELIRELILLKCTE